MTSGDDRLDGALRQLREASNPSSDERTRILAAVQRVGSPPLAPAARVVAPTPPLGVGRLGSSSMLRRKLLIGGLSLGLATFGIGVGVGVGLGGRSPVVPPPELAPVPAQAAPAAAPAPAAVVPELRARELPRALGLRGEPALLEPATSTRAPPRAVQRRPTPQPKPRAAANAALVRPAPSPLSLAEALELLQRAERAIYSDNAAWAVSLLDQLDERAPRDMLHEERIATRILAWCADGQVENAERLASQAREEAPTSIYGAVLERACNGDRLPAAHSPRP
jgi:hypothetical protein